MKNPILKNGIHCLIALLFLLSFSCVILFHLKLDSDTLYPFSIVKDILTGVSIRHWYFPGPVFVVPDILVSFPIVYFFKTPFLWGIFFGFIQSFLLVFLVSYFSQSKKSISLIERITYNIFLMFVIYALGHMLFHYAWQLSASKIFFPVNHASTALSALLLFFLTTPTRIKNISFFYSVLLSLFVYSLTFSDPLFCLYFFCLNVPYVFIEKKALFKNKGWMITITLIAFLGCLGVLTNKAINPGMEIELLDQHAQSSGMIYNIHRFWLNVKWEGVILFFFVPNILIIFSYFKKQTILISLLFGIMLIALLGALFGFFNVDESTLRYLCIYFPVLVYTLFELLPKSVFASLHYTTTFFLIAVSSTFYLYHHFHNKEIQLFSHTISSQKTKSFLSNSILVATYWEAKVIFENTDRVAALIQVTPNLTPYHWINNPAWGHIVKNPQHVVIDTVGISPDKLSALKKIPHHQFQDDSNLLQFPLTQKLINLIPALQ